MTTRELAKLLIFLKIDEAYRTDILVICKMYGRHIFRSSTSHVHESVNYRFRHLQFRGTRVSVAASRQQAHPNHVKPREVARGTTIFMFGPVYFRHAYRSIVLYNCRCDPPGHAADQPKKRRRAHLVNFPSLIFAHHITTVWSHCINHGRIALQKGVLSC